MENVNRYVDLFKTYHIEYLIIIVFLVAIIFFWRYISKRPRQQNKPAKKAVSKVSKKRERNDVKFD